MNETLSLCDEDAEALVSSVIRALMNDGKILNVCLREVFTPEFLALSPKLKALSEAEYDILGLTRRLKS